MADFFNNGGMNAQSSIDQSIWEESSTQKAALGTVLDLPDGRKFRYMSVGGTALAAGVLVGTDYSSTCVVETDGSLVAAAIGATYVDATIASITANQLAGGYLHITDDAGEGYTYRIKSNDATDGAAGSGKVRIQLYDALLVAVTTATDFAITGCEYNNLVIFDATGGTDFLVSGVTPRTFTKDCYGWVQTKGIATVLCDAPATIAPGDPLASSDGIDGAVQGQDAYTETLVGHATFEPDDTGHVGIKLCIE